MHDLDWYLTTAREKHCITSDNKLARQLNISAQALFAWRQARAWPCDEAMLTLADLAGVPDLIALTDLAVWRAKTPRVQAAYLALAENIAKLKSTAMALVLAIVALFSQSGNTAQANATPYSMQHGNGDTTYSVYYGESMPLSMVAVLAVFTNIT